MRTALALSLVTALLAACSAPDPEGKARDDVDAAVAALADSAPEPRSGTSAEALDWTLRGEGDTRTLAYEMPETDDVQLGLTCDRNRRFVRLWREIGPDEPAEFRLASGEARTVYPGKIEPSEISAGRLEGVAPAGAPVFRAFRASGELTQMINDESQTMTATTAAKSAVDQFFAFCGIAN